MANTPAHVTVDIAADLTVIRPGDIVLVSVPGTTPAAQAQRIAEQLRDRLPAVADVLVLAGAEGITAYRPDDAASALDLQARCCGCVGAMCCAHGEAPCST